MKTNLFPRLLGVIFCASLAFVAKGQFFVTKADLHNEGSKLIIEYQIVNSKPSDRFLIEVFIEDDDGNIIDASSFSGDIGQDVTGGLKRITWEYLKDDIIYETTVTVKIDYKKQNPKAEVPLTINVPSTNSYTRSGLILQSLALPGLGMTKLKEKPYWLYGVAGYGLVGTSIYFLLKSNSFYNDTYYYDRTSENWDQYAKYYNTFLISACGAAVIWLTDLVLISVSSKNMNQFGSGKIQIAPGFDYRSKSTMLSMTYKF